jgi:hypothetical protein
MPRTKYRFHPACTIFPPLPDDELRELADDIATNGLGNPIVLFVCVASVRQGSDGDPKLSSSPQTTSAIRHPDPPAHPR